MVRAEPLLRVAAMMVSLQGPLEYVITTLVSCRAESSNQLAQIHSYSEEGPNLLLCESQLHTLCVTLYLLHHD